MAYNWKENVKRYNCIKDITKSLRKEFKGIQSNSYGFCCNSDYDAFHNYINDDDYVCCKLYKGGLNNDFDYTNNEFVLIDRNSIHFCWCLTNFNLDDIINIMENKANEYGYKIVKPINESKCIELIFMEE